MTWTAAEIQRDWLLGGESPLPLDELADAFNQVELMLGRAWIESSADSGGLRARGAGPTLRVAMMGKRLAGLGGAQGQEELLERLRRGDRSADAELAAINLLRQDRDDVELELGPEVSIGDRRRRPDFRIRLSTEPWTYVEVTRAEESDASERVRSLQYEITKRLLEVSRSFALEVVLLRELTEEEKRQLLDRAAVLCTLDDVVQDEMGDFARLLLNKSGPGHVVRTTLPDEAATQAVQMGTIIGGSEPRRHVIVRVPFADERAETILTAKARQLPEGTPGVVMVDVSRQPTALDSWEQLIPRRFGPKQHTRVSGVCLFMTSVLATDAGFSWRSFVKLISNPHAKCPVPSWITATIDEIRVANKRMLGYPEL